MLIDRGEVSVKDKDSIKYKKDVLYELYFANETDRNIANSIIDSLERKAAEDIKVGKVVVLPCIGKANINFLKRDFKAKLDKIKCIKNNIPEEQYKEYTKELFFDMKDKYEKRYVELSTVKRLKVINKKKYAKLVKKYNTTYANMYIFALSLLRPYEYDEEFEEQYNKISNENE